MLLLAGLRDQIRCWRSNLVLTLCKAKNNLSTVLYLGPLYIFISIYLFQFPYFQTGLFYTSFSSLDIGRMLLILVHKGQGSWIHCTEQLLSTSIDSLILGNYLIPTLEHFYIFFLFIFVLLFYIYFFLQDWNLCYLTRTHCHPIDTRDRFSLIICVHWKDIIF